MRTRIGLSFPGRKIKPSRCGSFLLVGLLLVSTPYAQSAREQWQDLNAQVNQVYRKGDYIVATPLAQKALKFAETSFGLKDPDTLTSLNNLARLYKKQSRYSEAEPMFQRALAMRTKVLGERHPHTLDSLQGLAVLFDRLGSYGKAAPMLEQALTLRSDILGERDPATLRSLAALALLYQKQRRYDEAESLSEKALKLRTEVLGERHPETLHSLNSLGLLHQRLRRYDEALLLFERALALRRQIFGDYHPETISSVKLLASLLVRMGRYSEAEPLFKQVLTLRGETIGVRHPKTLRSMNNLAGLYARLGRYDEAETLFEQALILRKEVLGERHPETLITLNDLALVLAALSKPEESVRRLSELSPLLLDRLSVELYQTEVVSVRRSLVASQSLFQNLSLSLAIDFPMQAGPKRVAALGVLRFKGLLAEEEAWMARFSRRSEDPRVQTTAAKLASLRQQLAAIYHGDADPDVVKNLLLAVNEAELALGQFSRDYANHLEVKKTSIDKLQSTLPDDSALVEYRRYRRVKFGRGYAEERWAAVVFEGAEHIRVVDLGAIEQTPKEIHSVTEDRAKADAAALSLHQRLIARLELPDRIKRLYFAPDDVLHLLPFHRLVDESGLYLGERYELHQLQSARDLLRRAPDQPASGLLALGGIDFGMAADVSRLEVRTKSGSSSPKSEAATQPDDQTEVLRSITAETFRSGFAALDSTRAEVHTIAQLYNKARPDERTEIWDGKDATEEKLKSLKVAPRVLHLATHGFYRAAQEKLERPMLLAGITLAGANESLSGKTEDGILYALEVQDLNLEGTELVVLSACETAQGEIAYADGVYGLVRALRTAGARNVLVTLRPIGDASASRFMKRFYETLLSQPKGLSNPSRALQDTQAYYIKNRPAFDWSPYVLVGG